MSINNKDFFKVNESDTKKSFERAFDAGFDYLVNDNKSSAEERKKETINSEKPEKTPNSDNTDELKLLQVKDQVRLEKNIFSSSKNIRISIYQALLQHYKKLETTQTESLDYLNVNKNLMSDIEINKILNYIFGVYKRNKRLNNESFITEYQINKISNNIISREWKKRGNHKDKKSLVKLMRFFELSDLQIFNGFERSGKSLDYNDLTKFNIDIKHRDIKVSKQDLEKLSYTLGKFKLKQFLIKLKNNIYK